MLTRSKGTVRKSQRTVNMNVNLVAYLTVLRTSKISLYLLAYSVCVFPWKPYMYPCVTIAQYNHKYMSSCCQICLPNR